MSEVYTIDHLPNRTIRHADRELLFFSGTAYLGIPQNPAFQALLIRAIGQYGTGFGSSRNGNLRLSVYETAEAKLATLVTGGSPNSTAALTLSSGMMAGQAVINLLRQTNHSFIYAPSAHPALWHEPVVALPTGSFADWASQLPEKIRTIAKGESLKDNSPVAILTNSIDAVRSEYYSFDWVNDLPEDRLITLIVDDSHGLGVLNNLRGIWPQIPQKPNVRVIVTASMAKAMGLPGGVVFSDSATLSDLRHTAFFGACSPMPPAYLEAYCQADALYAEGREKLRQNLLLAEKLLIPTGLFRHEKGYPVFFAEQDDLYPFLLEKGIFIYSFAYPTAADRANTRIVISAFHSFDDIQALAKAVYEYSF